MHVLAVGNILLSLKESVGFWKKTHLVGGISSTPVKKRRVHLLASPNLEQKGDNVCLQGYVPGENN